MNGNPRLKPRLPQSLVTTIQHSETMPTTSSLPTLTADIGTTCEQVITHNKSVQVKTKTADRYTNCSIPKSKTVKPLHEEEEDIMMEIDIEEALPSTQGSTTYSEVSLVSSECVNKEKHGRKFMIELVERKPETYIGLPKQYYWIISFLEKKLNVSSFNIIITLYKLKTNISLSNIADMFEVSLTTLWRIFYKTLHVLSTFFKQLIFSPQILDVKKNLPSIFTTNKEYSNVYCIIDCLEVEIEKPSNPINQALTWSQYKNANTLKYLLATTPDGYICFVSAGFGGRTSDANIVESSGFLDVLPPNCTVLADRGFKHIDTILNKKNIKLLRPPSVSKDTKMSKQEAIKSKVIASLRIHVERVIRRVRLFKFLKPHSVINNKLIQHTDEVIIVACGLINLQNPIIKDE